MIEVIVADAYKVPDSFVLSEYRQQKAACFRHPESALMSRAAAYALDVLLRRHGLREADMVYGTTSKGKPYFENCPLRFNLSHSGGLACAALGQTEVGVDLQEISKADMRVAEKCFSESEVTRIREADEPASEFARIWSVRESIVKLTGDGLAAIKTVNPAACHIITTRLDGAWLSVASYTAEELEICQKEY